jgi:hypothetical protein
MKIFFIPLFVVLGSIQTICAQNINPFDTCANYNSSIIAFIPGYRDTLIANNRIRLVNPASLINGFELQLNDSSFKVYRFSLMFDSDSSITQIQYAGNKAMPINDQFGSYNLIINSSVITIDDIVVIKENSCYKISSLLYYTPRRSL